MRGLVVVAGIVLIGLILLGGTTVAETKKDVSVTTPAIIMCKTGQGTSVSFKANSPVDKLNIEGVCKKDRVPSGWTVECYTDTPHESVRVSFEVDGLKKVTTIVCS